jgi:hypothetical protein
VNQHPGYNVSNFYRVVVHGLTVDPRADNATTSTSFGPFSWERIEP